ncbi:MAG TPA: hypothetical protein PKN50_13140 [Spirochaetota bacterium]|nr:hypothetical protein [Spirochaetota bacterium]HPV39968.1 hypothetical protein [Spirochaetota bacterium]
MKRLISMFLVVIFTAGMAGCNNGGGMKLPFLGSCDPESPDCQKVKADKAASLRYMEYMYDNENGKRLNDQAMSGMPVTDELRAEVASYMKAPLLESLGKSDENTGSDTWWERLEVDAEKVAAYQQTHEGQQAILDYYSPSVTKSIIGMVSSGVKKTFFPEKRGMVIEIIGLVISAVGVATDIASTVERYNSSDAGGMTEMELLIFGKILKKL